jgi:Tripartite tricarboxylate transporter family receptor
MRLTRRASSGGIARGGAGRVAGASDQDRRGHRGGGSPDISGILGDKLGQSFVIENNSQGAGAVAQQLVAKSAPDGYTMIMLTAGYPPQNGAAQRHPFAPLDGFAFVTLVCG